VKHFFLTFLLILFALQNYSQNDFQKIDKHARSAPESLRCNLPELVDFLVKETNNEREKARSIFTWICQNIRYDTRVKIAYDYEFLFYLTVNQCITTECVLRETLTVCEGYANLFKAMANLAGLECERVSGYSSDFFRASHAWNAVKIENKWQIIDATNAAGYINSKNKFVAKYNDYFFFPDKVDYLTKYLPCNPMWQFCKKPVSIEIFLQGREKIKQFLDDSLSFFNYNDSIERYRKLGAIEREQLLAKDSYKFNSLNINYISRSYLIIAAMLVEQSNSSNSAEDKQNYLSEALAYYQRAESFLRTSFDIEERLMLRTCRKNIDKLMEKIYNLE